MKCPNCKVELECGCKACIRRNIKKVEFSKVGLIVWTDGEVQACASCGLTAHCDWWLDLSVGDRDDN